MDENRAIAKHRFPSDSIARRLGIVLDDLTPDTVRMHMQLNDAMLNWLSRVHGGAIYCLADAAFSVLGNNSTSLAVAPIQDKMGSTNIKTYGHKKEKVYNYKL